MKLPIHVLVAVLLILICSPLAADQPKPLRAHYIVTVADDFIVEVYHNGRMVPHSKREMILERFGATAERINVEVHAGDWLVFNVANNRLRWGGAYYFAAAGCMERDQFGFVSELETGNWSACDTFSDVDTFISRKRYFRHRAAQEVARPWHEGDDLMRQFSGDSWHGVPVWGTSRNTWIKLSVQ